MPLNFLNNGYFAGTVGIGTNSPNGKLEITSNSSLSSYVTQYTNDTDGAELVIRTARGTQATPVRYNTGDSAGRLLFQAYTSTGSFKDAASIESVMESGNAYAYGGLRFNYMPTTSPYVLTEGMRLKANGNVGIGIINPILKLHIKGTNSLPATSGTAQNGGIRIENGVNNGVLDIGASNATGAPGWLQATDKADLSQAYKLLLNPNGGNVGIGTTDPSESLEVKKDGGAIIRLHDPGTNSWKIKADADFHIYDDSSSDYLTILNSGDVGIGTTTPAVKLQVYGEAMPETTDAASVEEMLTLYRNGSATVWSGGATLALGRYSTGGGSAPKSRLDFKLKAAAGSNTALPQVTVMTMQADTKVGIGTITPTARLDITNGEGKFCVDSKTHALTNAFTTCLTVNLNSHTGCYVTLTCFGDWGSHSAAAYRGEFFLQNGANGYAEPGIILRQDDNTSNGTDQIVCQILDPTGSGNPKDFEIQIRTTATSGTTSFTGQLTYTVQGKFNSVT